ncbi:MAG TPA: mechanosensitive ion channel domain-containing protein [Propionibacteriaceae bacterium]|nr:mechanosensitive ion channel domain-containing protein [Propionibacteriaceae bacterium]
MPDWFPSNLAEAALFTPVRIVFLIFVALITRYVLHRLIDRAVRRTIGRPPAPRFRATQVFAAATSLPRERREQRIAALGSLGRSFVTVVVLFAAVVMVLAEMGFNIATIIAGTSVLGVTIAFGLQNVVKDFVAGVFMLVEDQLGVGDFVDMEKAAGTVEEVGLRVTQLRDDDGAVWYVRNGEVLRVGNFSQGGPGRPVMAEPAAPAPSP